MNKFILLIILLLSGCKITTHQYSIDNAKDSTVEDAGD